jgi:clan AA aspartic protease (TIGR02281 family)
MQLSVSKMWTCGGGGVAIALVPALATACIVLVILFTRPEQSVRYLSLSDGPTRTSLVKLERDPVANPNSITIPIDDRGNFMVDASVNGASVPMVFDTGASAVALTFEDAVRVGLRLKRGDFAARLETANGPVYAAQMVLPELSVDGIVRQNVDAYILPPGKLNVSLLGRSFWGRLKKGFSVSSNVLVLND